MGRAFRADPHKICRPDLMTAILGKLENDSFSFDLYLSTFGESSDTNVRFLT